MRPFLLVSKISETNVLGYIHMYRKKFQKQGHNTEFTIALHFGWEAGRGNRAGISRLVMLCLSWTHWCSCDCHNFYLYYIYSFICVRYYTIHIIKIVSVDFSLMFSFAFCFTLQISFSFSYSVALVIFTIIFLIPKISFLFLSYSFIIAA